MNQSTCSKAQMKELDPLRVLKAIQTAYLNYSRKWACWNVWEKSVFQYISRKERVERNLVLDDKSVGEYLWFHKK